MERDTRLRSLKILQYQQQHLNTLYLWSQKQINLLNHLRHSGILGISGPLQSLIFQIRGELKVPLQFLCPILSVLFLSFYFYYFYYIYDCFIELQIYKGTPTLFSITYIFTSCNVGLRYSGQLLRSSPSRILKSATYQTPAPPKKR